MVFGLRFGRSKKIATLSRQGNGVNRLYLSLRPDGWQWMLRDPEGATISEGRGEGPAGAADGGLDAIFGLAATDIGRHADVLKGLRDTVLLVEDADVVFVDGKGEMVRQQGERALRTIGAQLIGAKKSTFGKQVLGLDQIGAAGQAGGAGPAGGAGQTGSADPARDAQEQGGIPVFFFADADRISRQLGSLDVLALTVSSIAPLGSLLLRHAAMSAQQGDGVGCTLHISQSHSFIAVVNPVLEIAVVRSIPVGLATLVSAVASKNGLPVADARDTMLKRDLLSSLPVDRVSKAGDTLSFGVSEQALIPLAARLMKDMRETIDYFSEQRMGGVVKKVEVLRPLIDVKGLAALIQKGLEANVRFCEEGPLEAALVQPFDRLANLFTGGEGALVTVGKVSYTFDKDHLVPSRSLSSETAHLQTRAKASDSRQKGKAGAKNQKKRGRGRASSNEDDALSSLRNLFEQNPSIATLAGFFLTETAIEGGPDSRQDMIGSFAFGLLMAVVLYVGWGQFKQTDDARLAMVGSAAVASTENGTLRIASGASVKGGGVQGETADKVLWTEKFLTLGRNMDDAIWLTDVFLADHQQQVGVTNVMGKKMVVEGAVLPSGDGHILEISKFIRRLVEDKNGFMNDFADVTYQGAHIDASESDEVVRFRIEAVYDANKRVAALNAAAGSGDDRSPMATMQDNVKQREQATLDALKGKISH
ncbi:MAG: hypothetical protein HQL37_05835 [Alphaproteobacteria bacterium]|nr:hypothetical protein [Alphaproteobacteria bacterium]